MIEPDIDIEENQVTVSVGIEEVRVMLFYTKDEKFKRLVLQPGHVASGCGAEKMNRPTAEGLEEAKSMAKIALEKDPRFSDYTIVE